MKTPWMIATLLGVALGDTVSGSDGPELGWLAGHWCGRSDGARIEEFWLPPVGGVMPGVGRTTVDGRTVSFEFFRIEGSGPDLGYLAQPGGREATRFRLTEAGPNHLRFENPEHDFPTRVEYRREGDRLSAAIAGPGEAGATVEIPFEYRRCD